MGTTTTTTTTTSHDHPPTLVPTYYCLLDVLQHPLLERPVAPAVARGEVAHDPVLALHRDVGGDAPVGGEGPVLRAEVDVRGAAQPQVLRVDRASGPGDVRSDLAPGDGHTVGVEEARLGSCRHRRAERLREGDRVELALARAREVVEGVLELGLVECDAHAEEERVRLLDAQAQSSAAARAGRRDKTTGVCAWARETGEIGRWAFAAVLPLDHCHCH
eukprot:scaffold23268_cov67-Phaeocystis_antarctica.AAC.4